MSASALGYILAAANGTATAQPDPSEDLPFNYIPTGWVGITFIALFGITTAAHLLEAVLFRVWYMIPTLVLCGFCELLGWAGRYWGHVICTTIIAPSFMTAAMFLILPKIINALGPQYSRMPAGLYSKIFITADVTALIIQAAGGAMASIADTLDGANRGGNIMLAGIIIQLVAVALFTILALEFVIRYSLNRPARNLAEGQEQKYTGWATAPRGVMYMLVGLAIATLFIIIRSVYRTIELTDGWNGVIISTEKWFNWFDGMPIVVAMVTFNFFHPGYLLRDLGNQLPPSARVSQDKIEPSQV
ncbi:RTA1-domain-containing protein [Ceratobasidium sp. AG-I]|nr:RTA1-domain-containing protein [Ceratobasidium sp. AG-I]